MHCLKNNMQKIHDARTIRAKNNIRKMFALSDGFGFMRTEKENQLLEDLNPGLFKQLKKGN